MKNFNILFVLFFGLSLPCAAQEEYKQFMELDYKKLDSLSKVHEKNEDYDLGLPYIQAAREKAGEEFGKQDSLYAAYTSTLGFFFEQIGKYKEAEELYLEALEIFEKNIGQEHPKYAESLNNLAFFHQSSGNYSSAEDLFIKALNVNKKIFGEEHTEYALSLDNLVVLYYFMGQYSKAEPLCLQALAIFKKTLGEKDENYLLSANNLAVLYEHMDRYEEAESWHIHILNTIEILFGKENFHYSQTLNNLGVLYFKTANFSKAEIFLWEAASIRQRLMGEDHINYALVLNNLATLYEMMGHYIQAEKLHLKALGIRKKNSENSYLSAQSLGNLASLYQSMGNYDKAKSFYLESLSALKKNIEEDSPEYYHCLNNLATLYEDMGNYAEAEILYTKVLGIIEKAFGTENTDYALLSSNFGVLYLCTNNTEKAKSLFEKALDIRKKILGEEHPDYLTTMNNLANLYGAIGDFNQAEILHKDVLKIKKKTMGEEHPAYAVSLNNLALLYEQGKNYAQAEALYEQALTLRKKTLGEEHHLYSITLDNLASLYKSMGNYDKAEPLFRTAIEIQKKALNEEHPDYITSLNKLASLYLFKESYSRADSLYQTAYTLKNRNLITNFAWLTEKGRAVYWQKEKAFYSDLNRFAALAADALPQSAALAYNGNLVAKSLLLESSRALDQAAQNSTDSVTLQIYADLKEKRRLINHLTSTGTGKKEILDRYEAQADSLDRLLMQRLGEYAAAKRRLQIDWREVQNALKSNEAAVEFARYYDDQDSAHRYLALVLRPGYEYPRAVKLCTEKALQEIPAGRGFAELHRLVWDPIDSLLQGVKTVYYSPDGYLNNLSFGAFCGQGNEIEIIEKDKKRGSKANTTTTTTTVTKTTNCTYLADRYALHRLSTTRYLAEGLPDVRTEPNALILGGIDYDDLPSAADTLQVRAEEWSWQESDYIVLRSSANRDRMDYLPGTLAELQNLQKSLKRQRWTVRAYSDKNASEHTVKAELEKQSPAVLHIATHGFAFPEADSEDKRAQAQNPLQRCGLLLAGANHTWTGNADTLLARTGEDGILTALEVSNLSLENTQLVVLSACETGLGKVEGTEGVFGLNRGFKLAGVPCIIVSLWAVPDKETGELMTAFYTELAKSQDPVQAFEQAQDYMRKKYRERPDLWAGFVLVR